MPLETVVVPAVDVAKCAAGGASVVPGNRKGRGRATRRGWGLLDDPPSSRKYPPIGRAVASKPKKPRKKTVARGYGPPHRWEPRVKTGTVPCRRCGELIRPDEPWDLGHDDLDRSLPRAPEHRHCNRATRAHAAKRRTRKGQLYGPRVRSRAG